MFRISAFSVLLCTVLFTAVVQALPEARSTNTVCEFARLSKELITYCTSPRFES